MWWSFIGSLSKNKVGYTQKYTGEYCGQFCKAHVDKHKSLEGTKDNLKYLWKSKMIDHQHQIRQPTITVL